MSAKNRLVKKLMMTTGGMTLFHDDEEVDTGTAPPRGTIKPGTPQVGSGTWNRNPVIVKPGQKKPKNWAR